MDLVPSLARLRRRVLAPIALHRLDTLARDGLPPVLLPALRQIISDRVPAVARPRVAGVERLRSELASQPGTVAIYYSPRPHSAGDTPSADLRPAQGELQDFTMDRVARLVSTGPRWGAFLHLCADAARASTILELGSCAGIATAYMATSPSRPTVYTIEGSEHLAAIARATTARFGDSRSPDMAVG